MSTEHSGLKQALQWTADESAKKRKLLIRPVKLSKLAPGKLAYFAVKGDERGGEQYAFTVADYPTGPRRITMDRPDQLDQYVGDQQATLFIDVPNLKVLALLGEDKPEAYVSAHQVETTVPFTDAWKALRKGMEINPVELVRRRKLLYPNPQVGVAGAEPIDVFCRKRLGNVKMTTSKNITTAVVNPGNDRMGADVARVVMGGEGGEGELKNEWPDFVSITARVFERVEHVATVLFVLSFDTNKNEVCLSPVKDILQQAEDDAVAEMVSTLERENRHIYLGNPNVPAPGADQGTVEVLGD